MTDNSNNVFPLGKDNYKFIIAGMGAVVLGFLLMMGGKAEDPNTFNYDEIFSPVRITVAPLVILIGLGTVLYGIMKKPKED